jgi:hypothetical protein
MGYIGWARHAAATGQQRSPLDLFYLALQLFTLESGSAFGPKTWELEIARLLAPAVAAYTAVQALAILFVRELQAFQLRFARGHVIICGLSRKGFLLARAFHGRGDRVVVIEQDEENDFVRPCDRRGITVLTGDASDRDLLRKTGVSAASCLIAVCDDDSTNAEIAVLARELVQTCDGPSLTCLVHVVDPQLCELLRAREFGPDCNERFRLEFFNAFDMGARSVLAEFPPFGGEQATGLLPYVIVIGLGSMGQSLVVRAARSWRKRPEAVGAARLRVAVVDREAESKVQSLSLRYPQLPKVCELVPYQMDIRSPEYLQAGFLHPPAGSGHVTAIYVCLDNDTLGLKAGLTLLPHVRGQGIPVVVRVSGEGGLARLLRPPSGAGDGFAGLHAFALLERTCRPESLLGGTHETLARALHQAYVQDQQKAGQTPAINPALVPWDQLPADLKDSNRREADLVGERLRAVGYGIAPLTDWDAESFEFSPDEVETMARPEHERYVAERVQAGWSPGPRDSARKTNPNLVPWDQLSPGVQESNRRSVRQLPRLLAEAGLQVYRLALDG